MTVEILQASALLPEDATLPETKRLSVLACEAMGRQVRREIATWIRSRLGVPTVIFNWLDTTWGERVHATEEHLSAMAGSRYAGPEPGQRWTPVPDFASDAGQAEHLVRHALECGYAMRRDSGRWVAGQEGTTVSFWWLGSASQGLWQPPTGWLGAAQATRASAAEATTLAFLQLTGRVRAPEED